MLSSSYKGHRKIPNGLKRNVKLTTINNEVDWVDLKDGEYAFISTYGKNTLCAIVFKCPGCNNPLSVSLKDHRGEPGWNINFETLTATPSILHSRNGKGCGWHGYLTNGELKEC